MAFPWPPPSGSLVLPSLPPAAALVVRNLPFACPTIARVALLTRVSHIACFFFFLLDSHICQARVGFLFLFLLLAWRVLSPCSCHIYTYWWFRQPPTARP
ncbi:hypothetical protein V8C35DRAFT_295873 [Trichoderma chlorosporum]